MALLYTVHENNKITHDSVCIFLLLLLWCDSVVHFSSMSVVIFQSGESAEDKDGPMTSTSRRLKMLHDLVQAKKGHQSDSGKGPNRPNNRSEYHGKICLQVQYYTVLSSFCCHLYQEINGNKGTP